MTTYTDINQHANEDGLSDFYRLLKSPHPRFDSAKQFGAFARIELDAWAGQADSVANCC